MTRLLLVLLFLLSSCTSGELKPFTTDGCSSFPDGTLEQPTLWRHCCVAHDKAYWRGGTYLQRLKADYELAMCVDSVGGPAGVMELGVRAGGSPYWPTTYRWGYGWPYGRFYKELTDNELSSVLGPE